MKYLVSVQKFVDADSPEEAVNVALPEMHHALNGGKDAVMIEAECMETQEVEMWTLVDGGYE